MTTLDTSTAKQSTSLWKLGDLACSQLCRRVFDESIANDVFGRAAELAYYSLFAIFALMLIMMALFGLSASEGGRLQANLLRYFAGFLPPKSSELLRIVLDELRAHAGAGKLTFGIVSALWCVSGVVDAMIRALNLAYHVQESRSWIRVRAIAFGLSLLITILLLSAMLIGLAGGHFINWLGSGFPFHSFMVFAWDILRWPAVIAFVALSCSLIYYCGPNLKTRHPGIWLSPGSTFGVLVLVGGSALFRLYLHFSDSYSASYGSIGAVMILMLWLYLAAVAYLIGGEINAEIERAESR